MATPADYVASILFYVDERIVARQRQGHVRTDIRLYASPSLTRFAS